jgi:hypothetical protein
MGEYMYLQQNGVLEFAIIRADNEGMAREKGLEILMIVSPCR